MSDKTTAAKLVVILSVRVVDELEHASSRFGPDGLALGRCEPARLLFLARIVLEAQNVPAPHDRIERDRLARPLLAVSAVLCLFVMNSVDADWRLRHLLSVAFPWRWQMVAVAFVVRAACQIDVGRQRRHDDCQWICLWTVRLDVGCTNFVNG